MDMELVGGQSFIMSLDPERTEIKDSWDLLLGALKLSEIGFVNDLPFPLDHVHKIHRITIRVLSDTHTILLKTEGMEYYDRVKLEYCKSSLTGALCEIFRKSHPSQDPLQWHLTCIAITSGLSIICREVTPHS